jgi:hypothetical protein
LRSFQVLVGPNSSGKSAFLDVIDFLADIVSFGLRGAVNERVDNFQDLVWRRDGTAFSLAIEAANGNSPENASRYAVRIHLDGASDQLKVGSEQLVVGNRTVLSRTSQQVEFWEETGDGHYSFELSDDYPGLTSLPADRTKFPNAVWLRDLLKDGVQLVDLDKHQLATASPPGQGRPRVYDGQNLARSVLRVQESSEATFKSWIKHIQTSLPDVDSIRTFAEVRDRYLAVRYRNGIEVPAWMLSDGTLRLLALTLLAYMPGPQGIYLIEEPEVGLHPTAIETVMQSLSSMYSGQVLVTSHSPLLLGLVQPENLLCFQKTDEGTGIIPGDQHPMLQDWRSGVNISDLFAAGVLG